MLARSGKNLVREVVLWFLAVRDSVVIFSARRFLVVAMRAGAPVRCDWRAVRDFSCRRDSLKGGLAGSGSGLLGDCIVFCREVWDGVVELFLGYWGEGEGLMLKYVGCWIYFMVWELLY